MRQGMDSTPRISELDRNGDDALSKMLSAEDLEVPEDDHHRSQAQHQKLHTPTVVGTSQYLVSRQSWHSSDDPRQSRVQRHTDSEMHSDTATFDTNLSTYTGSSKLSSSHLVILQVLSQLSSSLANSDSTQPSPVLGRQTTCVLHSNELAHAEDVVQRCIQQSSHWFGQIIELDGSTPVRLLASLQVEWRVKDGNRKANSLLFHTPCDVIGFLRGLIRRLLDGNNAHILFKVHDVKSFEVLELVDIKPLELADHRLIITTSTSSLAAEEGVEVVDIDRSRCAQRRHLDDSSQTASATSPAQQLLPRDIRELLPQMPCQILYLSVAALLICNMQVAGAPLPPLIGKEHRAAVERVKDLLKTALQPMRLFDVSMRLTPQGQAYLWSQLERNASAAEQVLVAVTQNLLAGCFHVDAASMLLMLPVLMALEAKFRQLLVRSSASAVTASHTCHWTELAGVYPRLLFAVIRGLVEVNLADQLQCLCASILVQKDELQQHLSSSDDVQCLLPFLQSLANGTTPAAASPVPGQPATSMSYSSDPNPRTERSTPLVAALRDQLNVVHHETLGRVMSVDVGALEAALHHSEGSSWMAFRAFAAAFLICVARTWPGGFHWSERQRRKVENVIEALESRFGASSASSKWSVPPQLVWPYAQLLKWQAESLSHDDVRGRVRLLKRAFALLEQQMPCDQSEDDCSLRRSSATAIPSPGLTSADSERLPLRLLFVIDELMAAENDVGNDRRAIELGELSLAMKSQLSGTKSLDAARTLRHVANLYGCVGETHKQIELLHQARSLQAALHGENNIEVATVDVSLASAYASLTQYTKARELLESRLELCIKAFSSKQLQLCPVYDTLATIEGAFGKPQAMQQHLMQSLQIKERLLGPKHPRVASSYHMLANCKGTLGEHRAQANIIEEKVLPFLIQANGEQHVTVALARQDLANALGNLGQHQQKVDTLERVLPVIKNTFGEEHAQMANVLHNLGNAYGDIGNNDRKLELLQKAYEVKVKLFGANSASTANTLQNLGNAYGSLGKYEEMHKCLKEALAATEAAYGRSHPQCVTIRHNLAHCLGALGSPVAMRNEMVGVYLAMKQAQPVNPIHFAAALQGLAMAEVSIYQLYDKGQCQLTEVAIHADDDFENGTASDRVASPATPTDEFPSAMNGNHSPVVASASNDKASASSCMIGALFRRALSRLAQCITIRSDSLGNTHPSTKNAISLRGKVVGKVIRHRSSCQTCQRDPYFDDLPFTRQPDPTSGRHGRSQSPAGQCDEPNSKRARKDFDIQSE